jgi:hypothetical protein
MPSRTETLSPHALTDVEPIGVNPTPLKRCFSGRKTSDVDRHDLIDNELYVRNPEN